MSCHIGYLRFEVIACDKLINHDITYRYSVHRIVHDLCRNPSVYIGSRNDIILVTSYVDDILFLSRDIEDTQEVFKKISGTYSMTFQDGTSEYLGYFITHNKKDRIITSRLNGSIFKLLDTVPPKSFTKTHRTPFHWTFTTINEELLEEADTRV